MRVMAAEKTGSLSASPSSEVGNVVVRRSTRSVSTSGMVSSCNTTKRATFSGQVKSFEGGPGKGRPTLVLATSAGDKTFIVGPYRALIDANIEFVPGAAFTVTAAPNGNDDWVAITIKDDASGKELALRDAQTGRPAGGGCRGRRS